MKNVTTFENPVWFKADEKALVEDSVNIAVQVNGKLRTTLEMPIDSEEGTVKEAVFNDEKVTKHTSGKSIIKEIYVKNKIYNIVAK